MSHDRFAGRRCQRSPARGDHRQQMPRGEGQRGFTLMEIILVIVIGVTLLFSATVIFNVARNSAATSRARDKVLALQSLVEQVASAQAGTYPDMIQLPQLWAQHRPTDYDVSPWGGYITHGCPDGTSTPPAGYTASFYAGLAGQATPVGMTYSVGAAPTTCGYQDLAAQAYNQTSFPPPPASASVGELDYRVILADATASFWDASMNDNVTVRSYAISIRGEDDNDMFYQGHPGGAVP